MKDKFITYEETNFQHVGTDACKICSRRKDLQTAINCAEKNQCGKGYFIKQPSAPKRTRPRKSRDRRLLEALLKCVTDENPINTTGLTYTQRKQLIAIKEAMARKGVGK